MGTKSATSSGTVSTGSTGDGMNDFGSCDADGRKFCPFYYKEGQSGLKPASDWQTQAAALGYSTASAKLSLISCFEAHADSLSSACKMSLSRRQGINSEVNSKCAGDRGKFCQGVVPVPGKEPMVDCLVSHQSELESACLEALKKHESAKLTGTGKL